ncbi:MAG: hypothetical protein JWN04_2476 [Myxococcaceae bacterium]|nr:hypothetical protein [Myxococcaceae bacterium]
MNHRHSFCPCALAAAVLWLAPREASASCAAPPLKVLWTYPADGDQAVPTNAVFWALATGWRTANVTIDGAPLPALSALGERALGDLTPNQEHVLRLDYASELDDDAGSSEAFEIHFRTGDGPAARVPAPSFAGVERASSIIDSTCPEVVHAQDCFDTGQNTLLSFEVTAPQVIGWIAEGKLWPAQCGSPALFITEPVSTERCFEVQPLGPGGLIGDSVRYCAPALAAGPWIDAGLSSPHPSSGDAGPRGADGGGIALVSDGGLALDAGKHADASIPDPGNDQIFDSDGCSTGRGASTRRIGWSLLTVVSLLLARRRRSRSETSA